MNPIRGRLARARVFALVTAVAALGACSGEGPREARAPRFQPIGSFIADVDVAAGTITVTPVGGDPVPFGLTYTVGLEEIPVHQNGTWNDVEEGAVELRTAPGTAQTLAAGCYPSTDSFQGAVEIHSGFAAHRLVRPYVGDRRGGVLPRVLPERSDPRLRHHHRPVRTLRLPRHRASRHGHRDLELPASRRDELLVPRSPLGGEGGAHGAGDHGVAPRGDVHRADDHALLRGAGSGCGDTYFTVDGGAPTTYSAPIRLSGTHTVCYWSEDLRGNAETPPTCAAYTMTAPAATASYDSALHAPRCSSVASSCNTGTLVTGRGTIPGGVETNAPNTLGGTCLDGILGSYGSSESIDRVVLSTDGGGPLAPGTPVHLTADVIARNDQDVLDVWWTGLDLSDLDELGTVTLPAGASGARTLSLGFTLPPGPWPSGAIRPRHDRGLRQQRPRRSGRFRLRRRRFARWRDRADGAVTSPAGGALVEGLVLLDGVRVGRRRGGFGRVPLERGGHADMGVRGHRSLSPVGRGLGLCRGRLRLERGRDHREGHGQRRQHDGERARHCL